MKSAVPKKHVPSPCRSGRPWGSPATLSSTTTVASMVAIRIPMFWVSLVRLALAVGTEALFSPVRHPESNGYVERFHQEYNRHVWDDTYLADLAAVQRESAHFFPLYCASGHHAALHGHTPQEVHGQPTYRLPADFTLPATRWPLYEGRVHFIRQVLADNTVSVLNVRWAVPNPEPLQGVWVTIELRTAGATLAIYDAAPDVRTRRCLATYPFPVKEPILPRTATAIGRPGPEAPRHTTHTGASHRGEAARPCRCSCSMPCSAPCAGPARPLSERCSEGYPVVNVQIARNDVLRGDK